MLKKRRKKKITKFRIFLIFVIFLIVSGLYSFLVQFDNEVLPIAIKVSQKYATNIISHQINYSVKKVISDMEIYTNDFFKKSSDNAINYIDVDTLLVNNLCTNISDELSKNLKNINDTKIELPVGVFSGINAFSSFGPYFTVSLSSIGDAVVDYETHFQSVGINQINFQIYLKINASVSIINPMYKKDIELTRKIMIVNTVFNGEVPNTYLNSQKNL